MAFLRLQAVLHTWQLDWKLIGGKLYLFDLQFNLTSENDLEEMTKDMEWKKKIRKVKVFALSYQTSAIAQ